MTLEVQGVVLLGGILAIMRFLSCASGSGGANVILVDTCRLGVAWRATRPSFAGTRARHPPWSTPAMARASATAPAAEARSAWRPAGCGRRRFGRVIMVGSHPVGPGRLPWQTAQLNHLPRASTRTPTARIRRASAFNSSLTFRAVVLSPRTLACLPLGLEKAPPVCRADCPSSPVASTERCPVAAGRISAARSHWGGAAASPARHG